MKIKANIVITGMLYLTTIFIFMLALDKDNSVLEGTIIAIIALCIGVIVPSPKVDNRRGVLIW